MSTRTITFNDGFSSATAPTGVDGISNWVTAQAYLVSDVVIQGSKIYECLIAHTAGVFATDLAAVKWGEISQGAVDHTALSSIGTNTHAQIDTHLANTSNPHSVTKAQVGLTNVDDTSDATKNAASVTLTNKTITGADFRTPIRLDMKQDTLANLTTYASTAADGQLCFATDTKATYVVKNSSLSSVGGADAGINYILAPDADSGSTGWATYKNASGASTPDGTITGTANSTFAVSASTALRGTSNFLFTKNSGASRIGEGFYYPFTIDPSDKGKVLQCSFEYQIDSGTFVDDAMEFFIWDVTNSRLIAPAPSKLKNSGIIERFAFEFQSSIDSTSYRLFAHIGVATDSSNTIRFDNFILGPQAKLYGSAVTDWVSFTPTGSWTTNTTYTGRYRRIGDTAEFDINVLLSGAPNSATLTVNTPFTIDIAKGASNDLEIIGQLQTSDAGVASYEGFVQYDTPTNVICRVYGTASTYAGSNNITQAVPITYGNLDNVHLIFRVPIVGWSSSQILSQDADTRVVIFSGYVASNQALTANVTNLPLTASKDSHAAWTGSTYVVPVPGDYQLAATLLANATGGTMQAYVNAAAVKQMMTINTTEYISSALTLENLKAGDIISFRSNATQTVAGVPTAFVSISRISGPSQIAASESVSALYTGAPPTGTLNGSLNNVTFGTKVKDSHNGMSGATYTVPTSGTYSINAAVAVIGTRALGSTDQVNILVNGSTVASNIQNAGGAIGTQYPSATLLSYPMLAGQTVTVQVATSSTTPSYDSTASRAYFSITRTGQY